MMWKRKGRKRCRNNRNSILRTKKSVKRQYCEEKCAERIQHGRMCDQKEMESIIKKKTRYRRRGR
jgi:hypothetical protein